MFICANIERKKPSKNREGEDDRLLSRIFGGLMSAKRARCLLVENKIVRDEPIEIRIDKHGEELLNAFYEKISEYDYYWGEDAEYARASRWKEQCSRLVLILHLLEWSAAKNMEPGELNSINIAEAGGGIVSVDTVSRAMKLFEVMTEHSRYAYGKIKECISGQKFETHIRHKRELAVLAKIKPFLRVGTQQNKGYYIFDYNVNGEDNVGRVMKLGRAATRAEKEAFTRKMKKIPEAVVSRLRTGRIVKFRQEDFDRLIAM